MEAAVAAVAPSGGGGQEWEAAAATNKFRLVVAVAVVVWDLRCASYQLDESWKEQTKCILPCTALTTAAHQKRGWGRGSSASSNLRRGRRGFVLVFFLGQRRWALPLQNWTNEGGGFCFHPDTKREEKSVASTTQTLPQAR